MAYVEFLRLRNGIAICWSILIALAVSGIVALELLGLGHHIQLDESDMTGVPVSILAGLAIYPAAGMTTGFGWSLNRASENGEIVWTRPFSRVALALRYMLIDTAGIVLTFFVALGLYILVALVFASVAHSPKAVLFGGDTVAAIALGVGVCFMWFGLVQAATAWYSGRGGMVAGLSWAAFIILATLAAVKIEPFHTIIMALNFLNPLAYKSLSGFVTSDLSSVSTFHSGFSVIGLGVWTRVALAWAIGAVTCALAIHAWKRVEL